MVNGFLTALSGIVIIIGMALARKNNRYVRRTADAAMRYSPRRNVGLDSSEDASLLAWTRLVMRLGQVFGGLLVIVGLIAIARDLI
jgi:hypothetical protein